MPWGWWEERVIYKLSRLAVMAAWLLLLGCASVPPQSSLSVAERDRILSGSAFVADGAKPQSGDAISAGAAEYVGAVSSDLSPATDIDTMSQQVLALNDDMRLFVDLYVDKDSNTATRLRDLLQAIFHSGTMGLEYDPLKTFNAADTFFLQQGNCLSFTNMFVALGREAGLKVSFNEVSVPPTWDMHSASTHVYYRHMNAVVQTSRGRHIVDLNMENYDVDYPQRRVSDEYAMAQFFNNRAMELLFEERWQASFQHLRAALELEPEQTFLWGNLGSLYRRIGHFDEAELAFRQALSLDSRNLMAMSNLSRLYRQMDRIAEAEIYDQKVVYHRKKNPYYRYHQAQEALQARQLDIAQGHIKAAILAYDKDHRFYFLAARIDTAMGNRSRAQRYLQRAADLTRDTEQKARYNRKLDLLAAR